MAEQQNFRWFAVSRKLSHPLVLAFFVTSVGVVHGNVDPSKDTAAPHDATVLETESNNDANVDPSKDTAAPHDATVLETESINDAASEDQEENMSAWEMAADTCGKDNVSSVNVKYGPSGQLLHFSFECARGASQEESD